MTPGLNQIWAMLMEISALATAPTLRVLYIYTLIDFFLDCREASKFHNKISQYHINLISVTNSRGNTTKNLTPPGSQHITWRFFERFFKPIVT